MGAGRLDKRIVIRDFRTSQDDYGTVVQTWYDLDTVWGGIEPLAGKEYFEGIKVTADVDTRIVIRYRRKLKPSQRLQYGNREYWIVSILCPNEDRRYMHIMCKEKID